jgi:hypothetical protein
MPVIRAENVLGYLGLFDYTPFGEFLNMNFFGPPLGVVVVLNEPPIQAMFQRPQPIKTNAISNLVEMAFMKVQQVKKLSINEISWRFVIPAQAGIQWRKWIPACAGMTTQ